MYLVRWLMNYVSPDLNPSEQAKIRFPLVSCSVAITEQVEPYQMRLRVKLQPHTQNTELQRPFIFECALLTFD